jgi:hypothetical protein
LHTGAMLGGTTHRAWGSGVEAGGAVGRPPGLFHQ